MALCLINYLNIIICFEIIIYGCNHSVSKLKCHTLTIGTGIYARCNGRGPTKGRNR